MVGRSWTQSRPVFMDSCVGQCWHYYARGMEQVLDGVHISLLVVADVLERRADDNPSITAWNQIHLIGANDVLQRRPAHNRQHLSFNRTYRKFLRGNTSRPSPCAV